MTTLAISNAYVATVSGAEYPSGHLVAEDGVITAVGPSASVTIPAGVEDGDPGDEVRERTPRVYAQHRARNHRSLDVCAAQGSELSAGEVG